MGGPAGDGQEVCFSTFPNLHYTLVDHIETDSKLVLHWLAKGNHLGPLMKIPATGKNVFIHGMSILPFGKRENNTWTGNVGYGWCIAAGSEIYYRENELASDL